MGTVEKSNNFKQSNINLEIDKFIENFILQLEPEYEYTFVAYTAKPDYFYK